MIRSLITSVCALALTLAPAIADGPSPGVGTLDVNGQRGHVVLHAPDVGAVACAGTCAQHGAWLKQLEILVPHAGEDLDDNIDPAAIDLATGKNIWQAWHADQVQAGGPLENFVASRYGLNSAQLAQVMTGAQAAVTLGGKLVAFQPPTLAQLMAVGVLTINGTLTTGHCLMASAGAVVDAGAPCGGSVSLAIPTGLLKGNGSTLQTAVGGTDYLRPSDIGPLAKLSNLGGLALDTATIGGLTAGTALAPHVSTATALAALPTIIPAAIRDGYDTRGDTPSTSYHSTSAACSAPDGGRQVVALTGGCWVADALPSYPIGTWGISSAVSGTTNAARLGAALATIPAGGLSITAGAAPLTFTGRVSGSLTGSLSIVGAGSNSTKWTWTDNGGLKLSIPGGAQSTITVTGLKLLAGTTGGNPALELHQDVLLGIPLASRITDVSCQGSDALRGTNYFAWCVADYGVSNIYFEGLNLEGDYLPGHGNGVLLSGGNFINGVATSFLIIANFHNCIFAWGNIGIQYDNLVQGVTVNQTNFTNGQIGIFAPQSATELDQLAVSNSEFNVYSDSIQTLAPIPSIVSHGNLYYVSNNHYALNLVRYGKFSLADQFEGAPPNADPAAGPVGGSNMTAVFAGINVDKAAAGLITSSSFSNFNVGVTLSNASSNIDVEKNTFAQITGSDVSNAGFGNTVVLPAKTYQGSAVVALTNGAFSMALPSTSSPQVTTTANAGGSTHLDLASLTNVFPGQVVSGSSCIPGNDVVNTYNPANNSIELLAPTTTGCAIASGTSLTFANYYFRGITSVTLTDGDASAGLTTDPKVNLAGTNYSVLSGVFPGNPSATSARVNYTVTGN